MTNCRAAVGERSRQRQRVGEVGIETIVVVDTFGPARCRTHGLCLETTQVVDTQHHVRLASSLKCICVETTSVVDTQQDLS